MSGVLPRGLIVSCQARADNPLHGPAFMAAMAQAAEQGGAVALRANGAADVAAIRAVSRLPIIGIAKVFDERWPVYITPNFDSAAAVAKAGADVIAIDATARPRNGEPAATLIRRIRDELGLPVFADVDTLANAIAAADAGAAYVATTLSGYTDDTRTSVRAPDLDLLTALVADLACPVVAEGRYDTPDLMADALRRGAHAVVVGTAITNPREITRRFAAAVPA